MSIRLTTSATQEAPQRPPAQNLDRHKANAAAGHLSAPEQTKHDARNLERDVEALARMQAGRPSRPPGRRA